MTSRPGAKTHKVRAHVLYTDDDEPAFGGVAVAAPAQAQLAEPHHPTTDNYTTFISDVRRLIGEIQGEWVQVYTKPLSSIDEYDAVNNEKSLLRKKVVVAETLSRHVKAAAADHSHIRTQLQLPTAGGTPQTVAALAASLAAINNGGDVDFENPAAIKKQMTAHTTRWGLAKGAFDMMQAAWVQSKPHGPITANDRGALLIPLRAMHAAEVQTFGVWTAEHVAFANIGTVWLRSMETLLHNVGSPPHTSQSVTAIKTRAEPFASDPTLPGTDKSLVDAIAELKVIENQIANDDSVQAEAGAAVQYLNAMSALAKINRAQLPAPGLGGVPGPGANPTTAPAVAALSNWQIAAGLAGTVGVAAKDGAVLYEKALDRRYTAMENVAKTIGGTLATFAAQPRARTVGTEIAAAVRELEQERNKQAKIAAASNQIFNAGLGGYAAPGLGGYAAPGLGGQVQGQPGLGGQVQGQQVGVQWKPGPLISGVRASPMGGLGGTALGGLTAGAGEVGGLAPCADRDIPGWNTLQFSANGMKTREAGGVLLRYQMIALKVAADFLSGKPGKKPLRSMLVFHSMGSGKSMLAHAIVNLILGAADGFGGARQSLACRVALLWQSTSDAERQMAFLRANQFDVLGGQVAPGAEIPGVITGSIDNSADHDALKNQLGLPTRTWLRTLESAKATRGAATSELGSNEMKTRALNIEIQRINVDIAMYTNASSGGMYQTQTMPKFTESQLRSRLAQAKAEVVELTKKVVAGRGAVSDATAREQAAGSTSACTEKNPTLVTVDESHKILADGNLAYGILLACAVCGHARLVLMSGTPVTSTSPLSELVRLCMLVGGKPWVLAAIDQVVVPAKRAAVRGRVAAACTYGALQAVLNRGFDASFEERVAAADATLAQIGAVLREVEEAMTASLAGAVDRKKAITAAIQLSPLVVSYYGLLNGNVADHERYRDTFDEYDYSAILRKLRDTHVAAVNYTTQIDEEHEDDNFETFADGSRFTRTVDAAHYEVAADGKVAWRGVPVLRGPPKIAAKLWHSCREYVPSFVANRTVRVLHVSVPSYWARTVERSVLDAATQGRKTVTEHVKLFKPSPIASKNEHPEVPASYAVEWVSRNLSTAVGWEATKNKGMWFEGLGKQWGAYQFMWCLGVAFAAACASRFEGPEASRGPVAIYLDRKSYGLSAAQMELLVHAVFSTHGGAHKLHAECGRRGCPYQGPETPHEGVLSYQIGWKSLVDFNARPLSAWTGGFAVGSAAPAAFGSAPALDALVASFGPGFPLALHLVAVAIQAKTTLFDDEIRLDIASSAMRGRELMHVYVKDLWVTEPKGESVNPEGENLENCVFLIIVGMPNMGAQKMNQLYDRINRVNVLKKTKVKKHIMHITSPSQLLASSTLGMLGSTELDVVVSHITSELARNAVDCATNRTDAEKSAMACAKKWDHARDPDLLAGK